MVDMMTQTAEANLATEISDYRFCAYRLQVLKQNPNPDDASIVAVVTRMHRLASESPELRLLINEPHAHTALAADSSRY